MQTSNGQLASALMGFCEQLRKGLPILRIDVFYELG